MGRLYSVGGLRGRIQWMALPYNAALGFGDYGTFQAGQYGMTADGWVAVRGLCKSTGNIPASGTAVIATIPAGFRPLAQMIWTGWGAIGSAVQACRIDVAPDGTLVLYNPTAAAAAVAYLSLQGIMFPAEQ